MSLLDPQIRRHDRFKSRSLLAALLSVGFHVALLGLILLSAYVELKFPKPSKPPTVSAVQMRPLSAQQWAQNRGQSKPAQNTRAPAETEKPRPKNEQRPKGQVVDVAPGNGEEAPDSQYLAEKNNKVQKETKSRDQTPFYRNAMPQTTSPHARQGNGKDDVEKAQIAGNLGTGQDDKPQSSNSPPKAALEIPSSQRRSEIAMRQKNGLGAGAPIENRKESEEVVGNSNRLNLQTGSESASAGKIGQPGALNLLPSASVVDRIVGAAPNDHLKDVTEGDGTFLNTREWKYSSFFNRVKQSVSMNWNPGAQLRMRDPSGDIYGSRDRYTLLSVTINETGQLKDVYVEKSCGLDFLDLEAIRSFERSQPFPHPPSGLLESDSQIRFTFGFFLDMGGPRMGLFRMAN